MPQIKEVSVVLLDRVEISQTPIATISHLQRASPTVPPTVTVELGSRKAWTIPETSVQLISVHVFSYE